MAEYDLHSRFSHIQNLPTNVHALPWMYVYGGLSNHFPSSVGSRTYKKNSKVQQNCIASHTQKMSLNPCLVLAWNPQIAVWSYNFVGLYSPSCYIGQVCSLVVDPDVFLPRPNVYISYLLTFCAISFCTHYFVSSAYIGGNKGRSCFMKKWMC